MLEAEQQQISAIRRSVFLIYLVELRPAMLCKKKHIRPNVNVMRQARYLLALLLSKVIGDTCIQKHNKYIQKYNTS